MVCGPVAERADERSQNRQGPATSLLDFVIALLYFCRNKLGRQWLQPEPAQNGQQRETAITKSSRARSPDLDDFVIARKAPAGPKVKQLKTSSNPARNQLETSSKQARTSPNQPKGMDKQQTQLKNSSKPAQTNSNPAQTHATNVQELAGFPAVLYDLF